MRKAVSWLGLAGASSHCTVHGPLALQDVLRNWYARLPVVVQNARRLVRQTEKCAEAFRQGELFIHSEVNPVSGPETTPYTRPLGSCFLLVGAPSQYQTFLMGIAL